MKLTVWDFVAMGVYFGGLAVFGLFVRRVRDFTDYSVAGRAVPTSMVLASLCATYIGPGYSLGLAAKGAVSGFFFLLPFSFFSLQTVLVGLYLAPRLRQRFPQAHSLGDVMRAMYGREAALVTGLVSVGLCTGFAAVMARAGGSVLAAATGQSTATAVAIITGVGITYTFTGGLKSVIATEAMQFSIKVIVVGIVLLLATRRVPALAPLGTQAMARAGEAWRATSAATLFGLIASFFLGETLIPPYANRALAATSTRASRQGFVWAGVFSLLWFTLVVIIGVLATAVVGPKLSAEAAFIQLAAAVLPPGLLGLLLVLVATIVMSSQESVLNAGAVAVTRDVVQFRSHGSEGKQLLATRLTTLTMGVVSAALALHAPSIIDGLLVCYSMWGATVLPPLVWGLLGLPTRRWSGFLAILGGAIASIAYLTSHGGTGGSAMAVLVGLLGCVGGGLLGYFMRQNQQPKGDR